MRLLCGKYQSQWRIYCLVLQAVKPPLPVMKLQNKRKYCFCRRRIIRETRN